jgi:hypothetical protein
MGGALWRRRVARRGFSAWLTKVIDPDDFLNAKDTFRVFPGTDAQRLLQGYFLI